MIITTETADKKMSELIRKRDPMCARCHRKPSCDASHFYERHNSSVRYHPENLDGLCRFCHDWFHSHREEYKEFKKKQLGMKRYVALQRLAASVMKREEAIIRFMKNICET